MKLAVTIGLFAAAGCFNPTYHDPKCGPGDTCPSGLSCYAGVCLASPPPDDAQLDGNGDIDAPDARPLDAAPECVGSGEWELCFTGAAPTAGITLSGAINTDTSSMCATNVAWTSLAQPNACVIAAKGISVSAAVTATGTRPLVLLSTSTITMTSGAVIDVASHRSLGTVGAASQSALCAAFARSPAGVSGSDAGGGAGGTFMSKGGDGGAGGKGSLGGLAATSDATAPAILRGGCSGQKGADSTGLGGAQGKGGGAIYVAARTSIALQGIINASGAGGSTGASAGGGGGAGAGGMIVLWAPAIASVNAKLLANGGGGGGAGGSGTGQDGNDPNTTSPTSPALGGNGGAGNGCGGNGMGGSGAAGLTNATTGEAGATNSQCGGGGGGGGLGYIRSNVAISGLTASPVVSVVP